LETKREGRLEVKENEEAKKSLETTVIEKKA
jgi:hypothetical protein